MSRSESSAEQELERINGAAFDAAGIDLTQIDWMLSLTPLERLSALYETAASLARLMNHGSTDYVLGSLGDYDYRDLESDAPALALGPMSVKVLSLERLIEVKEKAGRDKDMAVLPLLRATLARKHQPSRG